MPTTRKRKVAKDIDGLEAALLPKLEVTSHWHRLIGKCAHLRNIRFTEAEEAAVMKGFKDTAEEMSLSQDQLLEKVHWDVMGKGIGQGKRKGIWKRVAALSGVERRGLDSIKKRCLRLLIPKQGRWTRESTNMLREAVQEHGKRWTFLAPKFGRQAWEVRYKFNGMRLELGKPWSGEELWQLRQAVLELTGTVAATKDVPWVQVAKRVTTRSAKEISEQWYTRVLPSLTYYQEKHGFPIEPAVFERLMLRHISKSDAECDAEIQFRDVNPWWSAQKNRKHWQQLQLSLPDRLGGGFFRGAKVPLKERITHLLQSQKVKEHKKVDKRLLKYAELDPDFDDRLKQKAAEDRHRRQRRGEKTAKLATQSALYGRDQR